MSSPPAPAAAPHRRHLRADAEHNRSKIVQAARRSFAKEGVQVSISEIARRSGVGLATVLRRFPDKSDLIVEVLADYFDGYLLVVRL